MALIRYFFAAGEKIKNKFAFYYFMFLFLLLRSDGSFAALLFVRTGHQFEHPRRALRRHRPAVRSAFKLCGNLAEVVAVESVREGSVPLVAGLVDSRQKIERRHDSRRILSSKRSTR